MIPIKTERLKISSVVRIYEFKFVILWNKGKVDWCEDRHSLSNYHLLSNV